MAHDVDKDVVEDLEDAGRKGDRLLGHLTPGDIIIPRGKVTEELKKFLSGLDFDLDFYTAGHKKNSLNPITGLPEFADGGGGQGFDQGASQDSGGFGQSVMDALGAIMEGGVEATNNGMNEGVGGGVDGANSLYNNMLMNPPSQTPPMNFGTPPSPLAPPTAPDVPDSLPQIGNYYALMQQGNTSAAENMLSQFLRGDRNVYGR